MVKKLYYFLFSCFLSFSLLAQNILPKRIQQSSNTKKAIYFNQIAKSNNYLDSAIIYTDRAIEYAQKCDCDSLRLASHFNKAYYLYHHGNYDEALKQTKAVDSINKTLNNKYYSFKSNELFSTIYIYTNEQSKALKYSEKALKEAIIFNDSLLIADSYYNLGYLFATNKMDDKAKKYLLISLDLYNKLKVEDRLKFGVYSSLMETSNSLKEFNTYSKKCFDIIKSNDANSLAYFYVNASTILINNKFDNNKAKEYALKGLNISDSINYTPLINIALYNLGIAEIDLKNYKKAIPYFNEFIKGDISNSESYLLVLEGLSNAYSGLKEYEKANKYKDEIISIKDSIYEDRAAKEFAEFDVKYKTEQKDKEIAQQQLEIAMQKNTRNYWIFGSLAIFLLGFSFFQWRYNKQKRKKLIAESNFQNEQEINELRTKFLGNIAHEIRTPLTLISGNLDLALENYNQKDKAILNIKTALSNSKKVVDDANGILELLKFEKNKSSLKLTSFNLNKTLKRIFLSFNSLAEIKHIELKYKSDISNHLSCKTDMEKLEKIFNNLVSNAIKYSPSNKVIIFKAHLNEKLLQVEVTDFGQGIHYNETEKIFQRFYQSSKNKAVGGIGIGLSLAKEFAELLDGTLTVESQLGKGSTFRVRIPVVLTELSEERNTTIDCNDTKEKTHIVNINTKKNERAALSEIPNKDKKPNILIVEDNPEMCNYIVEILSDRYECTTAFDGFEAFEKLKEKTFDLITSDIMMPRLDGFQLREKINENISFKNIPFILISAKTLEEDKIRGFNLGIDDYIVKPFNKNELFARIKNLLLNKRSREKWIIQQEGLMIESKSSDKQLLKKIEAIVIDNISNDTYKVADLASEVGYSQRQLTRLMKQYTGMSPVKFILEIRLQKAYRSLQNKSFFTLSEVRYDVGVNSSSYFNKKFKERFGINPSELLPQAT